MKCEHEAGKLAVFINREKQNFVCGVYAGKHYICGEIKVFCVDCRDWINGNGHTCTYF